MKRNGLAGASSLFAAAFSFMPLTSDVMVDTTVRKRGLIALLGLSLRLYWRSLVYLETNWKRDGFVCSRCISYFPNGAIFPLDPLRDHLWR